MIGQDKRGLPRTADDERRLGDGLVTGMLLAGFLAVYFLFDWLMAGLIEILPKPIQFLLILVGGVVMMGGWIKGVYRFIERDLARIEAEKRTRQEQDRGPKD